MRADRVRISCRQTDPIVGETRRNRDLIHAEATAAAADGAQIVVMPELAASGYTFRNKVEAEGVAEPANGDLIDEWTELAKQLNIVLVAGYAEAGADGRTYNSAAIVDRNGVRAQYRKVHLWDEEKLVFTPGEASPPVVDTVHGRLGLLICYDLEFPEWVRLAALNGADLLCAPVNWPLFQRPVGERPSEIIKVQAAAATNRLAIAACDRTGNDRGANWLGGSVIVDADGFPLTNTGLGTRASFNADVQLSQSRNKRVSPRNDVLADRRPDLYRVLTEEEK